MPGHLNPSASNYLIHKLLLHLQLEDVYTQTNEEEDDETGLMPDLGELRMRKKRKGARRVSVANAAEDGIRKASRIRASIVESSRRRGSMAQKGEF